MEEESSNVSAENAPSGMNYELEVSGCAISADSADKSRKETDTMEDSSDGNRVNIQNLEKKGLSSSESSDKTKEPDIRFGIDNVMKNGCNDVERINFLKKTNRSNDESNEINNCSESKSGEELESGNAISGLELISSVSDNVINMEEGILRFKNNESTFVHSDKINTKEERTIFDNTEKNNYESRTRNETDIISGIGRNVNTGKPKSALTESGVFDGKEYVSSESMKTDNFQEGGSESVNSKPAENETDMICDDINPGKPKSALMECEGFDGKKDESGESMGTDNVQQGRGEWVNSRPAENKMDVISDVSRNMNTSKPEAALVESQALEEKEYEHGESMEIDNVQQGGGESMNSNPADNGQALQTWMKEMGKTHTRMEIEGMLKWSSLLKELEQYILKHGTCNVKHSEDKRLYAWIHRQRRLYKDGNLSEDKQRKLKRIGYVFEAEVKAASSDAKWESNLRGLKEYILEHGTSIVKSSGENKQLCNWVHRQRSLHSKRKLSKERYGKLMDIGFHFDRESERCKGDSFERKIEELQKHKISTGTINVKYSENKSLYRWIVSQRKMYTEGTLSVEKIDKLIDVGVSLETNDEEFADGSYYTLPRANLPPLVIEKEEPLKISVYKHHLDDLINGLGDGQLKVEDAIERLKKMRKLT
mmetsp:Transcript_4196/g.6546  ORF Transcript_4196/g.6546 Transcript_4196/m.6546 type:complete len:653 (-) Transcript_4196:756-2714(-)